MRKSRLTITIILGLLLVLSGCKKDTISVLIPAGSPEYASLSIENDSDYLVEVVNGPDALIAGFGSEAYNFIIAPSNLGAKLYQAKDTYQLVGVITWGNYYLISNHSFDLTDLNGVSLTAFGQNQVSDIVLKYILDDQSVNPAITYLDSVTSVTSAFILNPNGYYLVAEPQLSILELTETVYSLDVQNLYEVASGDASFPQAAIFAKKDVDNSTLNQFLSDMESSISNLTDYPTSYNLAKDLGIVIDESIWADAVVGSNIYFKDATDSKDELIHFYELVYAFNPVFLGGALPGDSFYRS